MASNQAIVEKARGLPLADAAYYLLDRKSELHWCERQAALAQLPPAPRKNPFVKSLERIGNVLLGRRPHVSAPRVSVEYTPLIDWLRQAFPDVDEAELKDALAAAFKLDHACSRHFSYSSANYIDDVKVAVERAEQENPGFRNETYRLAEWRLATAMR